MYLTPATAWATRSALLNDRDYVGKKSAPEWGVSLSRKNAELLEEFAFEKVVSTL